MAEQKTKAERRQAAAAAQDTEQQPKKAERKAERGGRQAAAAAQDTEQQPKKTGRKAGRGGRQSERPADGGQPDTSPPPAEIESRLAMIEEAVASQAKRSDELLTKLDEVLREARKSAEANA